MPDVRLVAVDVYVKVNYIRLAGEGGFAGPQSLNKKTG
jgi:hypothetical protein